MLIESKCGRILPDWMRFVKGVVDSEDLPLSISREKAQDTALLKRIERVLVRKVLKFLEDEARKDPATYKEKFFKEFGYFLKVRKCKKGHGRGERWMGLGVWFGWGTATRDGWLGLCGSRGLSPMRTHTRTSPDDDDDDDTHRRASATTLRTARASPSCSTTSRAGCRRGRPPPSTSTSRAATRSR